MGIDTVRASIQRQSETLRNGMHVVNALLKELDDQLDHVKQGIIELEHYADEYFYGDGQETDQKVQLETRVKGVPDTQLKSKDMDFSGGE